PATFFGSLVLIIAGIAMYFLVKDASIPVLQPMGPIAGAQMRIIVATLLLSSIIVLPVFFLLFYFAWKYRAHSPESHVHHHPTWDHDNPVAEFIWWLVPSAIIAVIAIISWQGSHALDPYVPLVGENTLEVQVVALDWKWLFIYPDQNIASVNELVIPAGVPVHFVLTADAPMNTFWIPSLGGMIMVMPGMQTQLYLAADKPGSFSGSSGNLSGKGFSRMTFKTHALPQDQFDAWVERVQDESDTPLDPVRYEILARPSEADPVVYFHPVDLGLYTAVHTKYMTEPDVRDSTHHDL
ncbi:MAG: COX aromatic rich motif-containing protein, partial [Candidatus Pacebacteria bacterium]|nr:COX aromatic rich motif-containing protein [Candidatus Paceibacterota bacterium]